MKKKYDPTFASLAIRARKQREAEAAKPTPEHRFRSLVGKLHMAGYGGPYDLDSLLAACGPRFGQLIQIPHIDHKQKHGWEALAGTEGDVGSTAKEAVGRLLLKLLYIK